MEGYNLYHPLGLKWKQMVANKKCITGTLKEFSALFNQFHLQKLNHLKDGLPELDRREYKRLKTLNLPQKEQEFLYKAKGIKLVGDVNFESVIGIASAITHTGRCWPMTIAMLVENRVEAAGNNTQSKI